MGEKIKLGISSCLLGEKVRYDGGHKLDHYLKYTLGKFVEWVPVCPEVECGLPAPRESMRLVGKPEVPHLFTRKSHKDYTGLMKKWVRKKLKELAAEDLCGFVFKSKSPSCGMQGIKVYPSSSCIPVKKGIGLFAKGFMENFSHDPVEDDGRLRDPELRENFIEKVFVFYRWKKFLKEDGTIKGIVTFHSNHKLLIMSHSPEMLKVLGKITSQPKRTGKKDLFDQYGTTLMEALKLKATVKKNVNVLQHILGYFKKELSSWEKEELLQIIELYRRNVIPLIVPIVLLQHYVEKHNKEYLRSQYYLSPHPIELKLRNYI
ncbi:MAG: DUF523 and DUF1722 domain-containing protein [Candidatus Kuenenia sp.]|nr:DUF523 and DUF1722 domain-containing protein [Candidatus Kuenenia hertensis]